MNGITKFLISILWATGSYKFAPNKLAGEVEPAVAMIFVSSLFYLIEIGVSVFDAIMLDKDLPTQ